MTFLLGINATLAQNFAFSGGDTTKTQKKVTSRLADSIGIKNANTDKFIDADGDGINDARCGRGMGLGKGLGKHNCEPGNCENNKSGKGNQGQSNQGKGKGKK